MNAENILQYCLEEVAAGRKTPGECAALFPAVAGLQDQLRAASALRPWPGPALSPETILRHQAQLRAKLREQRRQAAPGRRPGVLAIGPAFRRVPAVAAALLVVLLVSLVTATAAAASQPGQALYGLKLAEERIVLGLTPAAGRAEAHARLAERRAAELSALSARGEDNSTLFNDTTARLTQETQSALDEVAQVPAERRSALLERLVALIERQQAVLAAVHDKVPAQALPGIERAQQASSAHRIAALKHLSEAHDLGPSDTSTTTPGADATATPVPPTHIPPGQAKRTATVTPQIEADVLKPTKTPKPGEDAKLTDLPPGHVKQTETAAAEASASPVRPRSTRTPPRRTATPNCRSDNTTSSNYCTPVHDGGPPATPCPTKQNDRPDCAKP